MLLTGWEECRCGLLLTVAVSAKQVCSLVGDRCKEIMNDVCQQKETVRLVPQGGRIHILQPSGIPLQPVASGIISATSMERGLHQTNSKSTSPQQPADFRSISITPILTRMMQRAVIRSFLYPAFLKPPPSLWFHYCCHSQSPTNCHQPAAVQSIRRRHFPELLEGVRHCPPLQSADQDGGTGPASSCEQLAGSVLRRACTPHRVQR